MGHVPIVERLLEGGANINYQDKVSSTCYAKDTDNIVQLMLAIHGTSECYIVCPTSPSCTDISANISHMYSS